MSAFEADVTHSLKARKEAFVSNLAGGTILEINSVTLVAPVRPSPQQTLSLSLSLIY